MTSENSSEEKHIRQLVEEWASAVRRKDLEGILRHHSEDIVMFDVPPPFQMRGLKAYEETWHLYFTMSTDPPVFDIQSIEITAGAEVAFAVALMRCAYFENGKEINLDFRLTIGFRKIEDQWTFVHEHHSIPAET